MAVAYVSDADAGGAGVTAVNTSSFAVGATSNPVIVVLVALNTAAESVSSVVCSAGLTGTATEIATVRNGTTFLSAWVIPAPSGTGTITVNFSAAVDCHVNFILFSGADQTTPCPTGAGNTGSASGSTPNPLTVTLSNLTANDGAAGAGANTLAGDAPTFSPNETLNNNSSNVNAAMGYRLGTGAVSVTWGSAASTDTLLAVRVVAAGGGETITLDKWFGRQEPRPRPKVLVLPSGVISIKT